MGLGLSRVVPNSSGTLNEVSCLSPYPFVTKFDCNFFTLHLAGLCRAQRARYACFALEYDEFCTAGLCRARHAI